MKRALLAAYAAVLAVAAARLSLWLDEIIQLLGTRDAPGIGSVAHWAAVNPGGVPGAYLLQAVTLWVLPFSSLTARIPSILASLVGCIAMYLFASGAGSQSASSPPVQGGPRAHWSLWGGATLAAVLYAVWPLQFRYAIEARTYGIAMCFGVVAALALLKRRPVAAAVAVAAALYTQPYAALIPASVWLWVVWMRAPKRAASTLAVAAGVAAFLPWAVYAKGPWRTAVIVNKYEFSPAGLTPLLLRELPGNYVILAATIALVALAWPALRDKRHLAVLIALLIAVPVAGALAADAGFGYFLAVRQFMFAVPGMVLAAAVSISHASTRIGRTGPALAVLLLAACGWQDTKFLTRPREDWRAAADAVAAAAAGPEACIAVVPESSAVMYEFFRPAIRARACGRIPDRPQVIEVVSPYTHAEDRAASENRLGRLGYHAEPARVAGGSRIRVFVRNR